MKQDYQVTLVDNRKKYRPISAVVKIEQAEDADLTLDKNKRKEIINKGIIKICQKRGWGKLELKTYNYLTALVRKYNGAETIAQDKERYKKIKEEKYKTGEWKRPKKER